MSGMVDRLVLVTSSFPIRGDGSEAAGSFVADLVEELSKHLQVRVVAPGPARAREQWAEGVEVFRYAAPARPMSTLRLWHPHDLAWINRILRGGLQATRAASTGGAKHILALWGLPCGEWARRVAREIGGDYSVWMLGSDVWTLGRIPVLRGMLARVIRRARNAYADGFQLAEDAQGIGGVPVQFLPSTRRIDIIDPAPPRDKPPYRLLFLGRWHPNKGVDLLLDALAELNDDDWRLIERVEIQGGGPLEALVHERVQTLQALGRPVEAGCFLPKAEAEAAIVRADWVLIPSRIESIPVVFSDAMKLGRPVVVTPVGDLPNLVIRGVGYAAGRVDSAAYAHALSTALLQSPAQFMSRMATISEEFSIESIAIRLLSGAKPSCLGAKDVRSE